MLLSTRQQDAYRFIRAYIEREGRAPSLEELALGLGIQSRGVAHRYVEALIEAGLLERIPGRHRGLRLTATETGSPPRPGVLPLLGRIAAGRPIEAIPDEDYIDLSEFFMGPDRFVLRVQGDSMIEAGILPGDMVIVRSTSQARNNDIVVALIDRDEATLKRFKRNTDGSISLIPANPNLSVMTFSAERVTIQGVVVGQMRDYS